MLAAFYLSYMHFVLVYFVLKGGNANSVCIAASILPNFVQQCFLKVKINYFLGNYLL